MTAARFTKEVMVRITPEMHAALVALSERNERTIATEVRRALRFYLSDTETQ